MEADKQKAKESLKETSGETSALSIDHGKDSNASIQIDHAKESDAAIDIEELEATEWISRQGAVNSQLEKTVPMTKDELIGRILIGKYEVLSRIGAGGMSVVYKARETTLKRTVALKMLTLKKRDDPHELLRFKQEAQAISHLEHENIVKIHSFETPDDLPPFMVMDYIEGSSLSELIEETGPLSEERAMNLFRQIAEALAHAHQQGVIHRDLKPGNVLITQRRGGSREPSSADELVKIVDFGIAKLEAEVSGSNLNLTQTGDIFGSPLYMSPEQCSGRRMDARSDIYSFGCVMYEILTGHPPFEGNTAVQTIQMHMHDKPTSLMSERKDLKHGFALDSILLKALAKEPAQRFHDMDELCQALSKIRDDSRDESAAASVSPLAWLKWFALKQRAGKSKGVPSYVATVSVVVALAATAFAGWHFYDRYRLEEIDRTWPQLDREAQSAFDHADYVKAEELYKKAIENAESSRSKSRRTRLRSSLEGLLDLYVAQKDGRADEVREQLKALPVREEKVVDPIGPRLDELSKLSARLEEKRKAIHQSSDAQPMAMEKLKGAYSDLVSRTQGILLDNIDPSTYRLRQDSATKQAMQLLKETTSAIESEFKNDGALKAKTYFHMGLAADLLHEYPSAKGYYEKMLEVLAHDNKVPVLNQVQYLSTAANVFSEMGEPAKSIPLIEKALELSGGADGDNRESFMLCYDLALALRRYGDMNRSRHYAERALAAVESLPLKLPLELDYRRARLNFMAGRIAASHTMAVALLNKLESQEDKDYAKISVVLSLLADIYVLSGDTMPQAEAMLMRDIAIEKRLGLEFSQFQDEIRLAQLCAAMGDYQKQVAVYEAASATAERLYGKDSETMGCFINDVAYAQMKRGDFKNAEQNFKRSLAIFTKNKSAPRRYLIGSMLNLATVYAKTGRRVEARELHDQATQLRAQHYRRQNPG